MEVYPLLVTFHKDVWPLTLSHRMCVVLSGPVAVAMARPPAEWAVERAGECACAEVYAPQSRRAVGLVPQQMRCVIRPYRERFSPVVCIRAERLADRAAAIDAVACGGAVGVGPQEVGDGLA